MMTSPDFRRFGMMKSETAATSVASDPIGSSDFSVSMDGKLVDGSGAPTFVPVMGFDLTVLLSVTTSGMAAAALERDVSSIDSRDLGMLVSALRGAMVG